MKTPTRIFCTCLIIAVTATSHAVIMDRKQVHIDFTNAATATNQATWAHPAILTVSNGGFGFDGNPAESRDGWIQTKPLALGLSWRPAFAISVRVTVQPEPKEFTLANGQKTKPDGGDVYIRYSPDLAHWSSWQALQRADPQILDEKRGPGRHWNGTVRVPYRDRAAYGKLVSEYSTLDVPWKSDEEATVQWILGRDPDFFAKQLPFLGYVEFLFETSFCGSQRTQSFHADISYGMSGLHSPPRDGAKTNERDFSPWRFKATNSIPKAPTSQ